MKQHCINIFIDRQKDDAGFFLIGDYTMFKTMLVAAAIPNEEFGTALIDAALEYANIELEQLQQQQHD